MMENVGRTVSLEPLGDERSVSHVPLSAPTQSGTHPITTSSGPRSSGGDKENVEGPSRILIVDDDHETARGMSRILSRAGSEVHVVTSGRAALEALGQIVFDVILSDIGMPEMDGFDLIHAIRDINAEVPIVLLTGEPTVGTAARALEVGAFRYITKPTSPTDLMNVVEKASQMHRMARVKEQAREILGRESRLGDREALSRNFDRSIDQLWVAFQPIVDARSHEIYGYEALMRSREPSLPHPGAILDAAETLGRLDELGRRIRALTALSIPNAMGTPSFFVNLHVRDLLDPSLTSPKSPLLPFASQVVLEVTERASLTEVPDVRQRIYKLREAGFRIAVDDLGAGYAGLTSFALLEPEIVKLDMSLIRDVHVSPTKRKVVRSMANLAQDMGMLVVAEGIETVEERDAVVALGCDFLQGYLLARPAPPFPEVSW